MVIVLSVFSNLGLCRLHLRLDIRTIPGTAREIVFGQKLNNKVTDKDYTGNNVAPLRNKETEWNKQPLRSPLLFQNKSQ